MFMAMFAKKQAQVYLSTVAGNMKLIEQHCIIHRALLLLATVASNKVILYMSAQYCTCVSISSSSTALHMAHAIYIYMYMYTCIYSMTVPKINYQQHCIHTCMFLLQTVFGVFLVACATYVLQNPQTTTPYVDWTPFTVLLTAHAAFCIHCISCTTVKLCLCRLSSVCTCIYIICVCTYVQHCKYMCMYVCTAL